MPNATPNLNIPHIATNQSQKEVTANTAFDDLDTASNGAVSIDVSGSSDVTPLPATLLLGFSFTLTGNLGSNINLLVPAAQKFYRFTHSAFNASLGSFTITVKVSGHAGVTLNYTDEFLLYCDGTTVYHADNGAAASGTVTHTGGGMSAYEVVIGVDGANDTKVLGSTGTSGQVLTSQGSGADPVWADTATPPVGINTQAASYTAVLGDAGKLVRMNNGSSNNFTVPTNASVAFVVGTVISVRQVGAGTTTIVASGGVTITSPSTLALRVQYSTIQLIKVATDTWDLMGDVA
jgi:hypothetical protein